MTSKSAFEISSDQKVHLVSAANKIGKFCWPDMNKEEVEADKKELLGRVEQINVRNIGSYNMKNL